MNQVLLTRLFRSIKGPKDSGLMKVAFSILEDERKKGHNKLADKLEVILGQNISELNETPGALKLAKQRDFKVPVDRRYRLPLASHIEHEILRNHMVLAPEVEAKVMRIEKEYLGRDRLAHHGLKPRKKILMYGTTGCGKSMAAERIAWDLGLPFYKVRFDTIISSYLGESASNLHKLLESIQEYPCVLLLDEFDLIGKHRNTNSYDVGEIHRIVNILLGLLEEYDGDGLLIATTNLEGSLDKALFRRFDDLIEFPKPTEKEIEKLLKVTFSALKLSQNIDLTAYANKMVGLSYAIIVKIANDAAKRTVIDSGDTITLLHLNESFEENNVINR